MKTDRVYIDKEGLVRMSPDGWPIMATDDDDTESQYYERLHTFEAYIEEKKTQSIRFEDQFSTKVQIFANPTCSLTPETFYTIEPVEVEIIDACNNESCPDDGGCEHCQCPVKVASILTKVEEPDPELTELLEALKEKPKDGWISVKDRPLYTEDGDEWITTPDGYGEFIAAVPEADGKWWIHHCIVEDEIGLCVVGDTDNEPAGYELSDVTHFQPLPSHPKEYDRL
jgi:hypothetical protein